jgi:hypothetical protein
MLEKVQVLPHLSCACHAEPIWVMGSIQAKQQSIQVGDNNTTRPVGSC